MLVQAYSAKSASAKLEPTEFESGPIGANELDIFVTHCGICHSDVHLVDNDWGITEFPIVPGHEIIGKVVAAGAGVKGFKPGTRVGVGWQANSCGHCEWCAGNEENLCATSQATCNGRPGGFSTRIRVNSRFAFEIPTRLDSAEAAPLMCAGITMFTPLRDYEVRKGTRVGIVGLGGLGHLGVQFAKAMGAEVTVFSTHSSKEPEARRFGAARLVDITSEAALEGAVASQDLILATASADLPWNSLINALRPHGTLVLLGVPPKDFSTAVFPLIAGFKEIVGSNTGSCERIEEMLKFAAKHNVRAQIETFPIDAVNDAMDRVRKGEVRYRAVLTT